MKFHSFIIQFAWLPSVVQIGECFTLTTCTNRYQTKGCSTANCKSKLLSSPEPVEDDGLNDELSKLIGKRSQIKRSKKKEEIQEEELDKKYMPPTPIEDIDLEQTPELKTNRIERATPQDEEPKKSKKESKPKLKDYTADYDDENEFHIPNRMGITTKNWGEENAGFVASGKKLTKKQLSEGKYVAGDLQVAYNELVAGGVVLIETSPTYGEALKGSDLSAEHILARCIAETKSPELLPLIVGTYPNKIWNFGPAPLLSALSASCESMKISNVDIYQPQNAGWFYPSGGLVKGMTQAVIDAGTTNYVGTKNLAPLRLRRVLSKFDKEGLILATNSFEYSLTNRKNGKWIDACKILGVTPLAENPLDGGLASGVYTATNPTGGKVGDGERRFAFEVLDKVNPLHTVQETVAQRVKTRLTKEMKKLGDRRYGSAPKINTDITTTQVALNYVVAKGAVPLVEVNNPQQAREVLGCLGWSLTEEELKMLDSAADLCS